MGLVGSCLVVISCRRWLFAAETTCDIPSVYTRVLIWSSVSLPGPAFVAMILSALSGSGGRWQASNSEGKTLYRSHVAMLVLPEEVVIFWNHVLSGCLSWLTVTRRSPVGPSKVATTVSWAASAILPLCLKEQRAFYFISYPLVGETGGEKERGDVCDLGEILAVC